MKRFKSDGHPFFITETDSGHELQTSAPLRIGDSLQRNPICTWGSTKKKLIGPRSFRDRIPQDIQQRFRWIARDSFLSIPAFYKSHPNFQYMKPFWQKVGQGILSLKEGVSKTEWIYTDEYGRLTAKFSEPFGEEIGGTFPTNAILHCQAVIQILCFDGGRGCKEEVKDRVFDAFERRKSFTELPAFPITRKWRVHVNSFFQDGDSAQLLALMEQLEHEN